MKRRQYLGDTRDMRKKLQGCLDVHVEHIGDSFATILDRQGFAVVALALTDFTAHRHVRQKLHVDELDASAFTRFAASTLGVERKASYVITPYFGFGSLGI